MANGNENEESYAETLKIPLIVGVSGHRDIKTPEDEIKKLMDCFWEKIREAAGPNTEIILLSSIAMGADHLAVKYRPAGMKYCVVLPFDEKDYREDFSGPALADFEADLKDAYKIIFCKGEPKNYTLASDYVRKHSDVLLTLWDGNENRDSKTNRLILKPGGTYYQIRKAFGLDDLLTREKIHLIVNLPVTRAEDHPKDSNCKYTLFPGFPSEKELMVIEKDKDDKDLEGKLVFTPFSEYDFGNHPVKSELGFFAESLKYVCKLIKLEREATPEDPFCDVLKFIRNHNESVLPKGPPKNRKGEPYYLRDKMERFKHALTIVNADFNRHEYFDHDAESHQSSYRKQFYWLIVITLIMGILRLTLKRHDDWIMNGVILLYLAGVVGVFQLWIKIDRQDHYTKYLEPRILAELLRLQIFWTLAGIRESFSEYIFTEYIFDESASFKFMTPILNWEIADAPLSEEDRKWLEKGKGFPAVKDCWLKDQTDYYQKYLLPGPEHSISPKCDKSCSKKNIHLADWFKNIFQIHKIIFNLFVRFKKNIQKYFQVYERLDVFFKRLKVICTVGGYLSAILLFVYFVVAKVCEFCEIGHDFILDVQIILNYMVPISFLGAAVLGWLMGKQKWDDLGRQYRKTWKLFNRASVFFDDDSNEVEDREDKRQMVKELVKFAHEENAEWQDLQKHAKPEPMF